MANPTIPRRMRFGDFEADLVAGELRKDGFPEKILLQDQPLQILCTLVARPGEMVSREELIQLLWNGNTNVDFDPSLNKAVNRHRESLGDSAEAPRYIETLSRRGYRFIAPIEVPGKVDELVLPVVRTSSTPVWPKFVVWVVVATVCMFAARFIYYRFRPRPEPPTVTVVPFTSYPGFELCPAFSPDGSRIAFAWNGDPASGTTGFDLYVKVIGSESLLRLTHHPSDMVCPTWSPDGTQIAFLRFSGDTASLHVVPAIGGPESDLLAIRNAFAGQDDAANWMATVPQSPVWSPDGKWIVFGAIDVPGAKHWIHYLSVETHEIKEIPHAEGCLGESWPAFSHSAKQWAYLCMLSPALQHEFGIYTAPSSGGLPSGPPTLVTRITTGFDIPSGIAWTADDERLIVQQTPTGLDYELDEVTLADGSLRKLPFGQDAWHFTLSPKGDKLAFVLRLAHHSEIWRRDLLHPKAAAVNLIPSTRSQDTPQYSPDGKHIALMSNRGGPWEIWMSDADGANLVKLSDVTTSDAAYPRWSPDSQRIAFYSRRPRHPEVYVVDIAERLPRKLVSNLPDMLVPSWSHDGKWIYFQSNDKIFRCPAAGGDAVQLSASSGAHFFPRESYDGETLYFANQLQRPSIRMISLKRPGAESVLGSMPALDNPSLWTVVPEGIYFVPAAAPKSLRYFDFATRQVRPVFEVSKRFEQILSVSPDGRWILYTQIDEPKIDIMLVENFR